jgi:hypothetical protein
MTRSFQTTTWVCHSRSRWGRGTVLAGSESLPTFEVLLLWKNRTHPWCRSLAYSEMRLILARVIFNFDMQLVDEKDDWMDQEIHLLWRKKPLNVFLTPVYQ